jgi:hypothetical protein
MSSKYINGFVFINPSPVLCKISDNIKSKGFNVKLVKTNEIPMHDRIKSIHYFYNNNILTIKDNLSIQDNMKALNFSYNFKKSFFNFKSKKFVNLKEFFNEDLIGRITDLQILKLNSVCSYVEFEYEKKDSYSHVFNDYNDNWIFIASWYPDEINFHKSSKYYMEIYRTDFDVKETFGNDYFVIFTDKNRIEIFGIDDYFYLVSDNSENLLEDILKKFKFLDKYKFDKIKKFKILRNDNNYVVKSKGNKHVLFNDYGFFSATANMPKKWIDSSGAFLCSGKL